jgi:hypothetical protein
MQRYKIKTNKRNIPMLKTYRENYIKYSGEMLQKYTRERFHILNNLIIILWEKIHNSLGRDS